MDVCFKVTAHQKAFGGSSSSLNQSQCMVGLCFILCSSGCWVYHWGGWLLQVRSVDLLALGHNLTCRDEIQKSKPISERGEPIGVGECCLLVSTINEFKCQWSRVNKTCFKISTWPRLQEMKLNTRIWIIITYLVALIKRKLKVLKSVIAALLKDANKNTSDKPALEGKRVAEHPL